MKKPLNILGIYLFLFAAVAMLITAPGICSQGKGKEMISIYGGKSGTVAFKHHLHQDLVGDCQACHKDFKQEEGALKAAKEAGILKRKQVMNKTCIACHRAKKKAGETSGPTSCRDCHKK